MAQEDTAYNLYALLIRGVMPPFIWRAMSDKTFGAELQEAIEYHGDQYKKQVSNQMKRDSCDELYDFVTEEASKYKDDFYIQQITETVNGAPRAFRDVLVSRSTCPLPDFDQVVYKCNKRDSTLSFLWVIPEKDFCRYVLMYPDDVNPDLYDLVEFVYRFAQGDLTRMSFELNNIDTYDLQKHREEIDKKMNGSKLIVGV